MEKKEVLQWHPAFFAGIQIELEEEREYLSFENEHQLGTKPKEIDVLIIKKDGTHPIHKNIGRIFRGHNLIEYKSPADSLNIDDFYKVYGYACFYKSDSSMADVIPIDDLTITFVCHRYPRNLLDHLETFVCHRYPRNLLDHLEKKRSFQIQETDSGIFYVTGDFIPIQIIVTKKLSKEENLWLASLTDHLDSEAEAEKLVTEYRNHTTNKLYQSVMDIIVRANHKQFEEAVKMCEALKELFEDEFNERETKGKLEAQTRINSLILRLSELGRTEDIVRSAKDPAYQEQLLKELNL